MKYLLIIMCLVITPVYAGDRHHPKPDPINVPDDGSNHNALAIGIVIMAGVACYLHKCWKPKPVKVETSMVPEPTKNEYTYTIKP